MLCHAGYRTTRLPLSIITMIDRRRFQRQSAGLVLGVGQPPAPRRSRPPLLRRNAASWSASSRRRVVGDVDRVFRQDRNCSNPRDRSVTEVPKKSGCGQEGVTEDRGSFARMPCDALVLAIFEAFKILNTRNSLMVAPSGRIDRYR